MQTYRCFTIRFFLILSIFTCLHGCVHGPLTLSTFRETDQYSYLSFDTNGDSLIDYVQRLDRGKGWKDVFYLDLDHDGIFEEEVDFNKMHAGNLVHIVFAADGFPFRIMKQLRREGYFRLFRSVGKMIAPYPSLTGVSWPKILGHESPPGYETDYYNPEKNRMEEQPGGHVFRQDNEIISSFQHARAYVQLKSYARSEMKDRYRVALEKRGEKTILLYFLSPDAAGHRADQEAYRQILIGIDRLIEQIFHAYRCRCRLTILSDHGNNRVQGKYVDLIGPLEAAGYHATDLIESERDFVVPRLGMIGVAAFYTDQGNLEPMASILSKLKGVNFCVYPGNGVIHVVSSKGVARVEWRKHRFKHDFLGILSFLFARGFDYLYDPVTADPLHLLPVIEHASKLETNRFCPEGAWFMATENHKFPDPLRRLVDALQNNVKYPASLLVDLADGSFFSGKLHYLAKSAGTHGNLGSASSLGMIGSNWRDVPPATRADDVNRVVPGLRR